MKQLKKSLGIILLLLSITSTQAQDTKSLLGKWKSTFELEGKKVEAIYEFKMNKDKLEGFSVEYKNEGGEVDNTAELIMDKISMANKKGEGRFIIKYDGDTYKVDSDLILKDNNTLEISYSYYGYSDTETWTRMK